MSDVDRRSIYRKLGVSTREELLVRAVELDLVSDDSVRDTTPSVTERRT